MKHLKGITLFAVPTVNCYRRINNTANWSPCNITWGFGNRLCTIRVKIDGDNPDRCYMEYRLPCSANNPYYVIASVLLAGMDGIKNKIIPEFEAFGADVINPHLDDRFEKIPMSLRQALEEFKKDEVVCKGFGENFVDIYCQVKEMELEYLDEFTGKFGDRNTAERFLYSKL